MTSLQYCHYQHTGLLIIRGKKSEISRDLKRQIRGENGRFRGNFRAKFSLKSKQESKKDRFLTKILEGCQIQGKKETQKFIQHSSEGNCTCFERQEKHIKLYRNAWPVNLLFQLQFRVENSNAINFFPLIALLCCFAVYKARLF